jgi:hypothetical protein
LNFVAIDPVPNPKTRFEFGFYVVLRGQKCFSLPSYALNLRLRLYGRIPSNHPCFFVLIFFHRVVETWAWNVSV